MTKTNDQTAIAEKLLQVLTKATDKKLSRSHALRSLHTTAAALDEVAEKLRSQGQIGVEVTKTKGRPGVAYTLSQKSAADARLEAIGRLIVEAVRLAGGVK